MKGVGKRGGNRVADKDIIRCLKYICIIVYIEHAWMYHDTYSNACKLCHVKVSKLRLQ